MACKELALCMRAISALVTDEDVFVISAWSDAFPESEWTFVSPNALTAKTASKLPTSTLRVVCEGRGLMFESVGFMCVLESPYYSRKEEPEEPPSFALRATVGREESEEPEDKRY
jgi:hypothetical protein